MCPPEDTYTGAGVDPADVPKMKFESWVRKAIRLAEAYRCAGTGYKGAAPNEAKFYLEEHLRKCPGPDPLPADVE